MIFVLPLLSATFSISEEISKDDQILISNPNSDNPDDSIIEKFMETKDFSIDETNDSGSNETEFANTNSDAPECKTEK